jgi:hypothetical protein
MTSIIKGYHGTNINYVNSILSEGFKSNVREDHWLGQGIYFYADFELAKWWAEKKFNRFRKTAAIIYVEIKAESKDILDLDTLSGYNFFLTEIKQILSILKIRIKFSLDKRIENLCFALDLLKNELGINVIIRTFPKKNPSYGGHNISDFEKNYFNLPYDFVYLEKQICVTNNTVFSLKECIYPKGTKLKWS